MSSIKESLRRLELICKYANKIVDEKGMAEQKELSKLDYNLDDRHFRYLLKTTGAYPDFNGLEGVSFNVRNSLYKRIGSKLHYITLLEVYEDDWHKSNVCNYEAKSDIDECPAIQELKTQVRAMIKNPDNFYRSE